MPAGASAVETWREMPAEVSRSHSSLVTRDEGPNRNQTKETASLTAVVGQKESWKAARLSGTRPSETGKSCTSVPSSASEESHSIESQLALRQVTLVMKPPDA